MLFANVSCKSDGVPDDFLKNVSVAEAKNAIDENKSNNDFVILDIRTASEYQDGNVDSAINIDYYADDFESRLNTLDKSKTYLLYCKSGGRSEKAYSMMQELKFKRVLHIHEGFDGWLDAGYETVK